MRTAGIIDLCGFDSRIVYATCSVCFMTGAVHAVPVFLARQQQSRCLLLNPDWGMNSMLCNIIIAVS